MLLCLGTLRLASLSINTDSADQERQRPPCPRRWRAAHQRASHDVRCNRRRLLRNGFAMLRWYQRLGTTGKMKVVWLACQGAPPGPARGCRDEGLVGDCMEKVGLQACPVHIQIAPPPTALSLSSYYLPSLRAYCFAPSSTLLHAPSDRFSFPQLIVLSFHHVVSQAAPLAALRAASCSQRCKQRNRADCGCQPVASSGTSTTWWRRTGSTFSTLLSMVRSGEAVCAMHLQLQLPLHPSLACMDGA